MLIISTTQDFDADSILDFHYQRLGGDDVDSDVMLDMEASLPVYSVSGDVTPEPTRVTPLGEVNSQQLSQTQKS